MPPTTSWRPSATPPVTPCPRRWASSCAGLPGRARPTSSGRSANESNPRAATSSSSNCSTPPASGSPCAAASWKAWAVPAPSARRSSRICSGSCHRSHTSPAPTAAPSSATTISNPRRWTASSTLWPRNAPTPSASATRRCARSCYWAPPTCLRTTPATPTCSPARSSAATTATAGGSAHRPPRRKSAFENCPG